MNTSIRSNIRFYKETLDNVDDMIKEHDPHYAIGVLKGLLKMTIAELEILIAEA